MALKLAFNPITANFDLVQDVSGFLKTDQTTPQTTYGTFTFPELVVDYGVKAGGLNVVTLSSPSTPYADRSEDFGYNFSAGAVCDYRIYAYKTVNAEKVYSEAATASYYDQMPQPASPPYVYGYQVSGSGYYAANYYSQINVYAYKTIGGVDYCISGYYYGYYGFYDDYSLSSYDIQWSWDSVMGADGYYITKYSDELGWYADHYIKIEDGGTTTLLDTGAGIWSPYPTLPIQYPTYDVLVTWDAVAGANGYMVFLDTQNQPGYSYYADTASTSFLDSASATLILGTEPTVTSAYGDTHDLYGSVRTNDINFYGLPFIRGNNSEYITFRYSGVCLGTDAGKSLSAGSEYNFLAGYQAGYNLADGNSSNVAIGYRAMYSGVSGLNNNICVGDSAGYKLTTGGTNVFIGGLAGYWVGPASNCIYIGYQAGTYNAGTISTGDQNIAIGTSALRKNTSGTANVAIGANALSENTTSSNNFAAGYYSLLNLPSGAYNLALGYGSGQSFTKPTGFSLSIGYWSNFLCNSNDTYGGAWYPINGDYQGAIGFSSVSQRAYALCFGGARNSNSAAAVGVGHFAPMYPLSVAGTMFIGDNIYTGLGAEKISNGTFTGNANGWTLGAGWQYVSDTVQHNSNGSGTLSQANTAMITPPIPGEIYQVEFTVSNLTSGAVSVACGGRTLAGSGTLNANSRYTYVFRAVTNDGITFYISNVTDRYTIDKVSMKRVTAGDLVYAGDMYIQSVDNVVVLNERNILATDKDVISYDDESVFYEGDLVCLV